LEDKKKRLLESNKVEWRMKRKAIWLEKGDEKTTFSPIFQS